MSRTLLQIVYGAILTLFGAGLVMGFLIGRATAHDGYEGWTQPGTNASCCNDADCRPTVAYQTERGVWMARIRPGVDGFAPVPMTKIVRRATDGRCHICEHAGKIYCFNPCDSKS